MTRRTWALFAAVSALSGSAYLFIKLAVTDLPPAVVVLGRVGIGAALLLGLAHSRGTLGALRGRLGALAVLAALEFAVPFTLIAVGSQRIASGLTGVLMAYGPLVVAVLVSRIEPGTRLTAPRAAGLLLGVAGTACLLGLEVGGGARELTGAGLVLAGAASFALGSLHLRRHFAHDDTVAVVAGALALSTLALLVPAALSLPGLHTPGPAAVVAVAVLGTAHAAVNFVLFSSLAIEAGAVPAAVTAYVSPVVAVVLGLVVLGERPGTGLAIGLPLVLAGSWLATR